MKKPNARGIGFYQNVFAGGDLNGIDTSNDTAKTEKLQLDILACIDHKPRRIIKLFPCDSCGGHYAPIKMTRLNICKKCVQTAQTKSASEKRRFVAAALNNTQKLLRRAVAL